MGQQNEHYKTETNGRLWTLLYDEIEKGRTLDPIKVKSHADSKEKIVRYGVSKDGFAMNAMADWAAGEASFRTDRRNSDLATLDGMQILQAETVAQRMAAIEVD